MVRLYRRRINRTSALERTSHARSAHDPEIDLPNVRGGRARARRCYGRAVFEWRQWTEERGALDVDDYDVGFGGCSRVFFACEAGVYGGAGECEEGAIGSESETMRRVVFVVRKWSSAPTRFLAETVPRI